MERTLAEAERPRSHQPLCALRRAPFARDAFHRLSGIAGNGKAITCSDNNGWRWEPW